MVDADRVGRYLTAGGRWARLLTSRRPQPGLRVSYGWDRVPGPGEPSPEERRSWQSWQRDSRAHRRTSRCSTSARAPCRAISTRCSGSPAAVGHPSLSTRTASGTRAGRAPRQRRSTARCARRSSQPTTSSTRALSRKRSADHFLGEPRGPGRSSRTRSTSTCSPRETPPAAGPVLMLGRRPDAGVPARARSSRRSPRCDRRHPDARLDRHGPARLRSPTADRGARARRRRRAHRTLPPGAGSRALPRAHLLLHTKVNDPCPTSSSRRWPAGCRSSTRRAAGRSSSSGDEAGIGVPHRRRARDARRAAVARGDGRRRRPRASRPGRVPARERAGGRWSASALDAWLDRHSTLFPELLARRQDVSDRR